MTGEVGSVHIQYNSIILSWLRKTIRIFMKSMKLVQRGMGK